MLAAIALISRSLAVIGEGGAVRAVPWAVEVGERLDAVRARLADHPAADVDARSIGYVEAHGTATPLGDPVDAATIEVHLSNLRRKLDKVAPDLRIVHTVRGVGFRLEIPA